MATEDEDAASAASPNPPPVALHVSSAPEWQDIEAVIRAAMKETESSARRERSRRAWANRKARQGTAGNKVRPADSEKSPWACPHCGTEQTNESAT